MSRNRPTPPPLFTRTELIRLMFMVAGVVLVVQAMSRVREPGSMDWLFGQKGVVPSEWVADAPINGQLLGAQQAAVKPAEPPAAPEAPAEVVKAEQEEPADAKPEPPQQPEAQGQPDARSAPTFNPLGLLSLDELESINWAYLEDVEDELNPNRPPTAKITQDHLRRLRVRANPAVYQLLGVASTTPPTEMAAKIRTDVVPTNLLKDPETYRGKPVRIEGVLRRLDLVAEGLDEKNPYGIERIYEGWVFVNGLSEAVRIWFTSLPEGLQPSLTMNESISFDGYFLKLYLYKGQDDVWRVSPMLLGYEPKLTQIQLADWDQQALWFSIAVGILFFLGMFALWFMSRVYGRQTRQYRRATTPQSPVDISFLAEGTGDGDNPFASEEEK